MRLLKVVVATILLWPAQMVAQTDQLSALQQLVGEWEVQRDGVALGVLSARLIAGGKGVNTVFRLQGYEAFGIWSVDPETKQVHAFEVNSEGRLFDHVGEVDEHGVLTLEDRGLGKGTTVFQVSRLVWESPDLILFTAELPRSGQKITYRMVRLEAAPPDPGAIRGSSGSNGEWRVRSRRAGFRWRTSPGKRGGS